MIKIKLCLILLLTIQCFAQFSDPSKNSQFLCYQSEVINKCECRHETNDILNIPLFIIDCSRRNFDVSPNQNALPLLMSSLDLSYNKIEILNEVLNSTTLQHLDYSHNNIRYISANYFDNIKSLISLNLSYNKINNLQNLLITLNQLKVLNLASNNLSYIPYNYFENLQQLEELDLSRNNLGQFFSGLQKQILPPFLTTLHLNSINLNKTMIFSDLKQMKVFTIIDNPIQEMLLLPFEELEYLDISGTNIRKIEEKHLNYSTLKELRMTRMPELEIISDLAFTNLRNLEVLTIEHCHKLFLFDSLVFGFLNMNTSKDYKLKKLSLARNNISYLYGGFEFLFRGLEEVHLNENPWNCGCELMWMTHLKNVQNVNDTICFSPPQLRYKVVTQLKPKEFVCLENRNVYAGSGVAPQKWLFPLIGVLSLIVIILVSVLFYLGPYVRALPWPSSIGPDSPYNRITIETNEETSRHL